jgi:hypothetical protein
MNKIGQLDEIISYFAGGNKSKFATMLGKTPQAINSWYQRGSFDIELIYEKCKGINADWLLTGEGDMLVKEGQSEQSETAHPEITSQLLDRLQQQAEEIGRLKNLLNKDND